MSALVKDDQICISASAFNLLQYAVLFKHTKKVQLHTDMSLKNGGPVDLLKGSQEPLGDGTSHFENHCSREA